MKFISLLLAAFSLSASFVIANNPNILFIAVDDLKPLIGSYGGSIPTPAIDRIAQQGTTFLNAHCQQAVCGPSRASLLTGKYPDFTQVWDLKTRIRDIHPEIVTLSQHFKKNGYHSVGIGKIFDQRSVDAERDLASWSRPYIQSWHLSYAKETGAPTGYYQNKKAKKLAAAAGLSNEQWTQLDRYLFKNNAWPAVECEDVPDDAYDDGAVTTYAVNLLSEFTEHEQPFFLAVGFKKPHLPFVAPKKYWDLFDPAQISIAPNQSSTIGAPEYARHDLEELRTYNGIPEAGPIDETAQRELIHGYYACVAYIDALIGKLLDQLEATGLAQNTIVVLWGDHGFHLGDNGLWCKHTNYEQATRVPLIISTPGGTAQKTRMPAELVDLYPTLCELAGIDIPHTLDGISLAPTMQDPKVVTREFAISQYPRETKMGYALRNERYRYVAWFETEGKGAIPRSTITATELYDYAIDPLEQVNLVHEPKYKELSDMLFNMLMQHIQSLQ